MDVNSAAAMALRTTRLFLRPQSASCIFMWKSLAFGFAFSGAALAQNPPSALEFANLREDLRGLSQRVGELTLRLEQLERENAELRLRDSAGAKSFATSEDAFLYSAGPIASVELDTSTVYPSAGAFATTVLPRVPPAPGRLSTTTDCFHASPSDCAIMRPTISLPPPGASGITMRTGLAG